MKRLERPLALICGVGLLAAISGVVAGCANADSDRIAFEVAYSNANTTPRQSKGYYITAGGDVFQYDFYDGTPEDVAPPERTSRMTESEVREAYGSSPRRIGSISGGEMRNRITQAEAARDDALVIQETKNCADSGQYTFRTFQDAGDGEYDVAIVGFAGKYAGALATLESRDLASWLSRATHTTLSECGLKTNQDCEADACSAAAAWCRTATSSTPWVETTECPEVDDCKACQGYACVIDSGGKKHCTIVTKCDEEPGVCASGEGWCKGDRQKGMSCSNPSED